MPSEITSLSSQVAFFISISSLSTFPSVEVFFGEVPSLDALINPDSCSIRRRRGGGGGGGRMRGEEEEGEEEEEEEGGGGGGGGGGRRRKEEEEEEEDNINEQLSPVSYNPNPIAVSQKINVLHKIN